MPSPTDPILFSFGPFTVRWYGLLIVIGALLAGYIGTVEARRKKEDPEHMWNLLIWTLIFGIIGARIYHVLSTPAGASRGFNYYFFEQPFTDVSLFGAVIPFPSAMMIWEGGIGIFGGLLGGVLALLVYCRRNHLIALRWMDIMAPGVLLAQAIGRWGNYFNQELYGPPTDMPWGILITNVNQRIPPYNDLSVYPLTATFHPVFLYESLWNLAGFVLLMWLGRKYANKMLDGDMVSLYLIWYPTGRLLIESLRPDAWTMSGIPTAQIISALLILLGVGTLWYRHRHPEKATSPETHPTIQPKRRRPARR
ncbi:MAG: prolipoprotein diacylglyceryl transferase [Anaerolineae bacterium]